MENLEKKRKELVRKIEALQAELKALDFDAEQGILIGGIPAQYCME